MCKYPNVQFTITGNGPPISSTGTIAGSEKSHFRYCVYRSFFFDFWLGRNFSHEQRERERRCTLYYLTTELICMLLPKEL